MGSAFDPMVAPFTTVVSPSAPRAMVPRVLATVLRRWIGDARSDRSRFMRDLWIDLKCYGAAHVRELSLAQIKGIDDLRVDGPVSRHSPLVVTALARLLQSDTIFEFGADTGDTISLLARNLPEARVFWLNDQHPDPRAHHEGVYRLRPPADAMSAQVVLLHGDSTTLDLLPYSGTADLVYIESTTRCAQLRADTDAAFGLLSELGCIVWDGYSGDTCVYAQLNALARTVDRPIFHIRGTRLAVYSRWDIASVGER